ncbi:MAG: ATPase [Alphaproteobacteria bacterium CG_4_10_14_0_2_um_filter_63_37]|nr:MAG: ATPase [Proteobacteria bacterium CG1_02_64_396]PJA24355.1 MAG: ATPase [Alphaproteobacteria bacterium CG_4_10_14_0_2_um_filter_63_37]
MEDSLKRLLDAEVKAEALIDGANAQKEAMLRQAIEDVRQAERRFEERIPEIQSSFETKAQSRAEQAVAALERRYHEREGQLGALAAARHDEAVEAAFALLIDRER